MYQTKFSPNNGKPRLWFRCVFQLTPDCAGEQTIYCSEDWRTLIPLPRTNALYHKLKDSHQAYEGIHDYWRDRYKVASDTLANRPKTVGLDWHRLRANVACLVDWLRIAAKAGWLGSARTAQRPKGVRRKNDAGRKASMSVAKTRARLGLYSPYGRGAKKAGSGEETPPSRRPRGAPRPASSREPQSAGPAAQGIAPGRLRRFSAPMASMMPCAAGFVRAARRASLVGAPIRPGARHLRTLGRTLREATTGIEPV